MPRPAIGDEGSHGDGGGVVMSQAAAMGVLHWSVTDLWIAFVAAGGARSRDDVEAHVNGAVALSDGQSDVLAAALNDALMERGERARVAYHDDPGT